MIKTALEKQMQDKYEQEQRTKTQERVEEFEVGNSPIH